MIDEDVAREALALLGTAAAMLVEDAHRQLTSPPRTTDAAHALAATLHSLGGDLAALGSAATVLTRGAARGPNYGSPAA